MTKIDESLANTINDLGLTKSETKKNRNELGQEEFLELMVTQLKNQDPFKPMENGQFIAQMAQFSSVTGLSKLQSSFDQFASSMQSNQALQASTMVGRNVMVPSESAVFDSTAPVEGVVSLPFNSQNVHVDVYKPSGEFVNRIYLGQQAAGDVNFSWNGRDQNGDPVDAGRYLFNAEASDGQETTGLDFFINAKVESVTLNQQTRGITLNLKDLGSVAFSAVKEIS